MKKFGDRAPNAHPQQQLNLVHRNETIKITKQLTQNINKSLRNIRMPSIKLTLLMLLTNPN